MYVYDVMNNNEFSTSPEALLGAQSIISNISTFSHTTQNTNKSTMYSKLKEAIAKMEQPKITRDPSEAIVVVLDISGSMDEIFADQWKRIDAVK